MAPDRYKYFRIEARELLDGLTQGVLELEKGAADQDRVVGLLRLAHTLKGASRVVKEPAMADLAHDLEGLLAPLRDGASRVPKELSQEALRVLEQINTGLRALALPPEPSRVAVQRPPEESLETIRVDVEEVESLLGRLAELGACLSSIDHEADEIVHAKQQAGSMVERFRLAAHDSTALDHERLQALAEHLRGSLLGVDRRLGEATARVRREFEQARELANRFRLLPCNTIFSPLALAVRDAAVTLGKQVELEIVGAEVRLDAQVLMILGQTLQQLVRNAVAHGIEDEQRRVSAGKSSGGRVRVAVERRGNWAAFTCQDDGAGMDLGAIRQAAVKKGVISAANAERLELRETIQLLLKGGVSTAGTVTGISGRGIGLNIVHAGVTRLNGKISIESNPGTGTTVEICVPVSLTSVPALVVESGGVLASIPLDAVQETLHIQSRDIAHCGARQSIARAGQAIPFLPLSEVLNQQSEPIARSGQCVVTVASGTAVVAIGVHRLRGISTELVRAAPALAAATDVVAGLTLDREGNPQIVLDPAALVRAAAEGCIKASSPLPSIPPVLVIDDSLTTRMVEQGILESAGYRVESASSAEEGLEKALASTHSLFLVDVEMPGIDGFEFVTRTRADPVLKKVPAILVTSRSSAEDRRRGMDAGAQDYIVKSEFDQTRFLLKIQQLVR